MARSKSSRPSRAAFTLLELMVVMVILAIAAAVVIPQATGTDDLAAMSAARMVASDLEYAQSMAVSRQRQVLVIFNPAGESYTLSYESEPLIEPMTKQPYVVDFPSKGGFGDLDVFSASFGGNAAVSFDELGSPNNGGVVVLRCGANVYQVELTAVTGTVTVTKL